MNKKIIIAATLFILIAIILGAFGAHALKKVLTQEQLFSFETGVKYQMYNGLSILILGMNDKKFSFSLKNINSLLIIGTCLFSFTIYLLSLQNVMGINLKFLGPITPVGGFLIITGWIVFLVNLVKSKVD